jgi:hypothetical protein
MYNKDLENVLIKSTRPKKICESVLVKSEKPKKICENEQYVSVLELEKRIDKILVNKEEIMTKKILMKVYDYVDKDNLKIFEKVDIICKVI